MPNNISLVNTDKKEISAAAANMQTPGVSHTTGNALAVFCGWGSGTTTITAVTDDAGNTFTAVSGSLIQNTTDGLSAQWFVALNITGGAANKVKATFSANSGNAMIGVLQYSGVKASGATDGAKTGQSNGTSGTAISTASITTTNANDVLIAGWELSGSSGDSDTVGSGFTGEINTLADKAQAVEDKKVTATGTYANGYTTQFSRLWAA